MDREHDQGGTLGDEQRRILEAWHRGDERIPGAEPEQGEDAFGLDPAEQEGEGDAGT